MRIAPFQSVNSFQLICKGTRLVVATKDGCYVASMDNNWKCEKLFHESTIPPRIVKVVPCPDSLKILCAYTNFITLFEYQNEKSLLSTRVLKTFCVGDNSISCSLPLYGYLMYSGCA